MSKTPDPSRFTPVHHVINFFISIIFMFKILNSDLIVRAKLIALKSPVTYWKNDTSGQLNTNVESSLISTNNRGSIFYINKVLYALFHIASFQ